MRHQSWIVAGLCLVLTIATFQRSQLYADPVALWRDAADKRPDNARAFDNLASSMLERDPSRLAEAEAVLRQAVPVDSSYLPALPNLAFVLEQQGRFPEAKSLLERALAINPDYVRAVERLGHVLVAMGEPEAALPHLQRVVNEFPNDENLVALGTAYLHLGRPDDATAIFRRALQLNPARTDAMTYLGVLLIEQERGADAVPVLEEAVRLEPGSGLALAALALAYAKSGRGDDAARLALTAGQRAAGDVTVHVLAGRALLLSQHPVEAEQFMEEALRLSPTDPEAIVRLGTIKVMLGKRDGAAQLFQRALSIDPDYVPAKRALEELARSPRH
jgi:tetratricopeptide (TPR) repeat protein